MNQIRYDAHCHIFTLQYAIKEAKQILFDILQGTYPLHQDEEALNGIETGKILTRFADLLKQLHELLNAAKGSEKENFEFLLREGKIAFPNSEVKIIPLMMDIYYLFAYSLDAGQATPNNPLLSKTTATDIEFEQLWNNVLNKQSKKLKPWYSFIYFFFKNKAWVAKKLLLEVIELERKVESLMVSNNSTPYTFHPTAGYCYHLQNLRKLEAEQTGKLFPFVAIDPRRPGIIEELKKNTFFQGSGRFYGVKLYPMLGYHPQCTALNEVYQYCSDHNLPITFHCSNSGFPPIAIEKHIQYGAPQNFEQIVKDYPNLHINFAHFGNDFFGTTYTWTETIVRLINENPNVYTDLSCYTNDTKLRHIKTLLDQNPRLQDRIMFGSDFDVVYFTGIGVTMQNYYDMFKSIFPTYLSKMMSENVEAFMRFNK